MSKEKNKPSGTGLSIVHIGHLLIKARAGGFFIFRGEKWN